MENVNEKPRGLVARISTLLNNEVCSDVVFHVRYNGQRRMFYAHSAVLIVAGIGFPELQKQTSQPKVIKISEFSPHIVEIMLTYLYTDELNILSMENAVDLYKLAREYSIGDLEKLCNNYITKEEVNFDNLFVKYESALSCDFPKLLEKCRHLAQSETRAVFASRYFGEAPFTVVQDIFSLDHLNVSSELDVIQAAFRWSACECRRKGRPTEKLCVRDAVDPLLKHLRFLSLSADEFCDFTAKDDNIFTAFETALLTRKILQPDYKGEFPKHLCRNSKPRLPFLKTSNHLVGMNNSSGFYSDSINKSFKDLYPEPVNKTFKDTNSESLFHIKQSIKDIYSPPVQNNNFTNSYFPEPVGKNNFLDYNSEVVHGNNSNNSSPEPVNGLKSGLGDAMFYRQSLEKSPTALTTTVGQKPVFQYGQKKSSPMLKVMPQPQPSKRTFDFTLQELRKDIRFASQRDIKCSARIHMRTGAIFIHGIELRISEARHNPDESIEVHSCISSNYPPKVETYTLELKNSMLSVMYPEPIRVAVGNPTDLEITIEDLHLNRCFVCQGQTYELNNGSNCMAEISVKSNQSNSQDNVLYLISRIFYTC